MAFLIEHTRTRVLRRGRTSPAAELPRPNLPPFSGLVLPRPLRSVPAAITALAIGGALVAGLSLHQSAPRAAMGIRAPSLIASGGPLTGLSLPSGISLAPANNTTSQMTAVLAADLWQAATQVYQAKLLGQAAVPAPTATATPSGPSVGQLVQAQLRLTQAQLAYQALTQTATQDQLTAARQAVAAAQAQVLAAQQAVQAAAVPTATPAATATPPPAPTDADLQQAQASVASAQAAFQRAEHPYTADQIAAAQTDLATAQHALAAAQTAAATPSATPAPAVSATPSPTPPATTPPPTAAAVEGPAPAAGVMPPPMATAPILQSASGGAVAGAAPSLAPGSVRATDSASNAPASADASTVLPAASVTPAPTPSPTPSATPSAASPTAAAPSANLIALQQQVTVAQQTLDRMTAPPNPATLQQAADRVAAAQGRLSDLNAARAAADAATPEPSPTPSPTPADAANALTPQQQLTQAQAQYAAAQQQLQALAQQPNPAAVQAAQDELNAAQQAWQALLAQADSGVVAQVTADPQTALRSYAAAGASTSGPDLVPFAWPARGAISSLFGPSHPLGIDIAQGPGLPVTAAASGVVSFSGGDPCCSYGYYVDITHPGGYMTRYGHLLLPSFLKPGDVVRQGQIIGLSGSTGFATGPHLHFEIRLNGVPLDPLKLLAGALPRPLAP